MNIKQLVTTLNTAITEENFSGVVLVKQGENVLYAKAAGLANHAYQVENTLHTRFGTASVTKMFTAVAVMQLVEEGRVELNTKVVELLELKETAIRPEVTIRHLLTHTSGIGDYFDEAVEDDYAAVWATIPNYSVKKLADMLPLFVHKAPKAQPGEEMAYSNAGFILLGLVIEKVTGQSYLNYIREAIFHRANMASADFLPLDGVYTDVAEGYIPQYDAEDNIIGYKRNIFSLPNIGASDGGAYVTAEDLCRFMQALRKENLLSTYWLNEFLQPRVLEQIHDGLAFHYGYGMYFVLQGDEIQRYGHPGEDPGFSCRVYYCPGLDLDFAIVSNMSMGVLPVMKVILNFLENQ